MISSLIIKKCVWKKEGPVVVLQDERTSVVSYKDPVEKTETQ